MTSSAAVPPPPGIYVPVPTFFKPDNTLDLDTQLSHALFLLRNGVTGIVLLGSTGEAVHILSEERFQLISHIADGLRKNGFPDASIIAGTASTSIPGTLKDLEISAHTGAKYGLVLLPGFFANSGVDQRGIEAWWQEIADKSPIPILLYHYPTVSNNVMVRLDIFRILSAHSNVVGAKFSHGDAAMHGMVALDPEVRKNGFNLFTGLGQHLLPVMQVGVAGAIDGLAAFYPKQVVRLWELASQIEAGSSTPNGRRKAKALQWAVSRAEELVVQKGTVGVKEGCKRIGFGDGMCRLPLVGGMSDEEWVKWKGIMETVENCEL